MGMEGKIAIVTGSGQGIGRAIAISLARNGAIPVIADINTAAAEKVKKEIEKIGISTIHVKTDVSNVDEIKEMVNKVVQK